MKENISNKKNILILLLAASMISLFDFSSCKKSGDDTETSEPVKSIVTLTTPEFNSLSEYIEFNAVTQFQRKDNIRASATGYVSAIYYNPGNAIHTGDIFGEIATKEQRALEKLSETDSTLQRFQKPLPVESNASGIISVINVLKGDYVNEGDVIASVWEPGSLVLNLNVPYESHNLVYSGKSCEIYLPDERVLESYISKPLPTVDAKTLSQVYLIRLGNISLPENLNVTVRIAVNQKTSVLTIPTKALQTDEEQKEFWVMKVVDDSIAVKIKVLTGTQNDSLVQIISDEISSDDKIILEGAYELPDSTIVTTEKE